MKQKLDYFDVSKRIMQIMREKGYNKNSLAKLLGMSQPTIKQIENNENLPSLKFLFEFKAAFPDVNCNWLLTGKGNQIDIVGEYDIQHKGRVEYELDADGYSMRYHGGTPVQQNDSGTPALVEYLKEKDAKIEELLKELTKYKTLYEQDPNEDAGGVSRVASRVAGGE